MGVPLPGSNISGDRDERHCYIIVLKDIEGDIEYGIRKTDIVPGKISGRSKCMVALKSSAENFHQ